MIIFFINFFVTLLSKVSFATSVNALVNVNYIYCTLFISLCQCGLIKINTIVHVRAQCINVNKYSF